MTGLSVTITQRLSSSQTIARIYLRRGSIHRAIGNRERAIEDYDNAVRLCPNYETDFIEIEFVYGGKGAVEAAIELLNDIVSDPPDTATDYYYIGVRQLFMNDGLSAERCFKIALAGYHDREKVEQHLENLKNRK